MKAVVHERYGSPEVLEIRDIEKPAPSENVALVKVVASSVNPADWYGMTGRPYIARPMTGLTKPKETRIGSDFAGIVEEVGDAVSEFQPGDEVWGMRTGALGEYVTVSEPRLTPKPANISFEEAAAVPVAAVTALQALRDHGGLKPGQHVLINGASGGVGTFSVQIAKALGAHVTGVCRTRNVDMVRSLGADEVIDYTTQDFTKLGGPYDLMIDNVASKPFSKYRRVLKPEATVVYVGGSKDNRLLGPISGLIRARIGAVGKSQKIVFFIAKLVKEDMLFLRDLLDEGKIKSVIDKRYELGEVREAFRYLGEGHARAKVVVTI